MSRAAGQASARTGPRAPISVQLVALLVAVLVAAQAISFAMILTMPPPRPPLYRLTAIAAALEGGSLASRTGRPMVRSVAKALPAEFRHHENAPHAPAARDLATILGRPSQDVFLTNRPPSALERFVRQPGPMIVLASEAGLRPARPAGGPPPTMRGPRGEPPILGEFAAALRRPQGDWVIVRSQPEPFPTAWQQRSLLWLLAGFAVVAPAGYLFARRITAPLKRFSEAAEQLGRDPHGPQMTLSGPAEVGAAAEAFNGMQARLKRYIDDRTAMVGAISHDLRTPLARIRFRMESAPPELRGGVLSDVAQMEQMIQGVLAFIRNESQPKQRDRLDLLSLVECVVDDAALVGGDVELAASDPVMVDGDAAALQRLFANLIDNAVKYGGQARVEVGRRRGLAEVTIADAGPGLSPDDLERVFQPFYRVDAARNLDAGGIGLGLPIARSTARAHGGDVELATGEDGLRAKVTLPEALG